MPEGEPVDPNAKDAEARARAAEGARGRAAQRRAVRRQLEELAQRYREATGREFVIPGRTKGGWKQATMTDLIGRLTTLLAEVRKD
jgi:hypothetical protein